MRVINPKQRTQSKERPKSRKVLAVTSILLLLAVGAVYFLTQQRTDSDAAPATQQQTNVPQNNNLQTKADGTTLKNFTGQQFFELYNGFAYPNTARIDENTPITGNEAADKRIRTIAIDRGYALRSAPVTNTFKEVAPGMVLQQRAAQPWFDMQAEAKKDGIGLGLTAAFRPAEEQRQIFTERLAQTNINPDMIATGNFDAQVSQVLRMTAIPGYSRHHTGYTIDISCENDPRTSFQYTVCFEWLSANNYEHAKKHGWIPSYPEGSGKQGPDPEAWEYVWVGTPALTE